MRLGRTEWHKRNRGSSANPKRKPEAAPCAGKPCLRPSSSQRAKQASRKDSSTWACNNKSETWARKSSSRSLGWKSQSTRRPPSKRHRELRWRRMRRKRSGTGQIHIVGLRAPTNRRGASPHRQRQSDHARQGLRGLPPFTAGPVGRAPVRGGLLPKLGVDDAKNQQNPVGHATGNEPLSKPEVKGSETLTGEIYECDALVCVS